MNLQDVTRGELKPARIIIYGPPGIGKTTMASEAPNPIFIRTEDGLGTLDVPTFPLMTSFSDVIDALYALGREEHSFQTVVIDSLDWLEPLIWEEVCRRTNVKSIEDLGYGRGYVEALSEWSKVFECLTALRDYKGMTILMLAHSDVQRIEDPLHPPYDCHTLKLHKKASARVREFADVIGFATQKTITKSEDLGFGQKRVRAISLNERVLYTTGSAAFMAKNRYGIPEVIPLSFEELEKYLPKIEKPVLKEEGKKEEKEIKEAE